MPPPEPAGSAEDALRRLEARLERATGAAERLFAEAASEAAAAASRMARGQPPPAGWQAPSEGDPPRPDPELAALIGALEALRDRVPPDVRRRLADAVRELLLALRALIDWYLERLERGHEGPAEVEDIPIL